MSLNLEKSPNSGAVGSTDSGRILVSGTQGRGLEPCLGLTIDIS